MTTHPMDRVHVWTPDAGIAPSSVGPQRGTERSESFGLRPFGGVPIVQLSAHGRHGGGARTGVIKTSGLGASAVRASLFVEGMACVYRCKRQPSSAFLRA